jgi:hypothetical protein
MNTMDSWLSNLGAKAKVIILDSGLLNHCKAKPIAVRNFTTSTMNYFAQHGNDMADIIASRDPDNYGVAPYCELMVAKVWDSKAPQWSRYEAALDWAIQAKVDVVSMSFGVSDLSDGFRSRLKTLNSMGAICIAAYSALSAMLKDPSILICGRLSPQHPAKALTVGDTIIRRVNGTWRSVAGTSVSTATLAGVAACAKAENPDMTKDKFVAALASQAAS